MPTVSGLLLTESVMINGHMKLLQCALIEMSENATYAGFAEGRYTCRSVCHHRHPSTLDASSSSYGICRNI
ncbi:hypothetical protein D3C84_1157150 [compost metagenome]